ncbi:MAG: 16S rRNA (cytidine(1402)-2'-O)-methyltransferase [Gammaproteobacteria bacterium]|nr:16S rRNA (cytidine(1402)-2'-O)-methyltransferase [Gammaproteobacteria bacterium]
MPGVLYIVATPIGNLDDISLRAITTLEKVDLIAAEDTRHSKYLLNHLGIDTRMISCHEHNEESRCAEILQRLADDKDVALISDAGTPLISDPGYRLVCAARRAGIRVSPIPGANSAIAALSAAGLATTSFHFFGFLSSKKQQRAAQLEALRDQAGTLVLFESSHRIEGLLQQLSQIFPDRQCVIAKELTKLREQFLSGKASELLLRIDADKALTRGEFVVLIDNSASAGRERLESDDIGLLRVLLDEVPVKQAVRIAARLGGKKNDLYQLALRLRDSSDTDISQ